MSWSVSALAEFVQLFESRLYVGTSFEQKRQRRRQLCFIWFNREETFSSSLCLPVRSSPKADEGGVTKSGLEKKNNTGTREGCRIFKEIPLF
jgi:hypothetical protein